MGCSFSGLNALYDAVNGGGDVWINENRFKIIRQLGEGGFAYVFLVKELLSDPSNPSNGISAKIKDSSHVSGIFFSLYPLSDPRSGGVSRFFIYLFEFNCICKLHLSMK